MADNNSINLTQEQLKTLTSSNNYRSGTDFLKSAFEKREQDIASKWNKELEKSKADYLRLLHTLEEKEKAGIITVKKLKEEQDKAYTKYRLNETKLLYKQEEELSIIHEKKETALKAKARNDYIKATLNDKQKIIEADIEETKNKLKQLHFIEAQNKHLTEEELAQKKELESNLQTSINLQNSMIEAKRKAQYENVSLEQKFALIQENRQKREKAYLEAKIKYDEEIAAIEEKTNSEIADVERRKNLDKNDKDYLSEEDAKKVLEDIGNLKSKGLKVAENHKKASEGAADIEFGKDTGVKGIAGAVIGGSLSEGNDSLSSILGVVDGVMDAISIVKGLFSSNPLGAVITILTKLVGLVDKGFKKMNEGVEMYAETQNAYYGKVNARLDGFTDENGIAVDFSYLSEFFHKTFWSNPYISQKNLLENVAQLTESGIAYNLEQRTILMSLSDRMVTTFNMLDATLTRLTRLQQADMSVAALGSQSLLTELLNMLFSDTSYMSDMYDSVAAALIEATSQMSYDQATSFNFAVQKWLGALYSLGMSQTGVSSLAEGIGYLATGNVNAFNSNDALRTLFALSSGGSYADLLVNGVSATNIDSLMQNIISYLGNISQDTNMVTKQIKAGVYGGLTLSDIKSVSNLTTESLAVLTQANTNWNNSKKQVSDYLLDFAQNNTTTAQLVDNFIENTLFNIGENLVNSSSSIWPALGPNINKYFLWKLGDVIGGDLGTTVQTLVNASGLIGAVREVIKGFGSIKDLDTLTMANMASYSNGNVSKGGFFQSLKNLFGGKTSSTEDVQTLVQKLVSDSILINQRGTRITDYNTLIGVTSGITTSSTVSSSLAAISNAVTSGIEAADTTSYSNTSDTYVTQTLASQAKTINNAAATIEDYSSNITRDINDIYRALFEEKLTMKVILTEVEEKAQSDLVIKTYNVSDSGTHDRLDRIRGNVVFL